MSHGYGNVKNLLLLALLSIGIVIAGISLRAMLRSNKTPAAGEAGDDSALVETEQPRYKHRAKSGDYLSAVVRSRDRGELSAAGQTLSHLGKAFVLYEAEKGKYPETLNDLVKDGLVQQKMILSGENASRELVYNRPTSQAGGSWAVVYDPTPQHGDIFAVLLLNGGVKNLSYKELDSLLKKQGSPLVK